MIRLRFQFARPAALAAAVLLAPLAHAGPAQRAAPDPFAQSPIFGPNGAAQHAPRGASKMATHVSRTGLIKPIGRQHTRASYAGRRH